VSVRLWLDVIEKAASILFNRLGDFGYHVASALQFEHRGQDPNPSELVLDELRLQLSHCLLTHIIHRCVMAQHQHGCQVLDGLSKSLQRDLGPSQFQLEEQIDPKVSPPPPAQLALCIPR
jgi:hypothetical protein